MSPGDSSRVSSSSSKKQRFRALVGLVICFSCLGGISLLIGIDRLVPPSAEQMRVVSAVVSGKPQYAGRRTQMVRLESVLDEPINGHRRTRLTFHQDSPRVRQLVVTGVLGDGAPVWLSVGTNRSWPDVWRVFDAAGQQVISPADIMREKNQWNAEAMKYVYVWFLAGFVSLGGAVTVKIQDRRTGRQGDLETS